MILTPGEMDMVIEAMGHQVSPGPEAAETIRAYAEVVRRVAEMPEPAQRTLDVRCYLAGFSADGPSEVPNVWHEIWLQARKLRGM